MAAAPTPPRASPSCARGLRAARSPRSGAPPHRSARSHARPRWQPPPPSPLLAGWAKTSSAASARMATAPTPPRASPSCARGSRAAPSPRSSAPLHCSARSCARPHWHLPPPSPLLAGWVPTSSAVSASVATSVGTSGTPPRASPSCARGSGAAPSPRSSAPPHRSAHSRARPGWHPPPLLTLARSLGGNRLCGIGFDGRGTYTTEGITKLCEGLRGSAITSIKCAAAP